MRRLLIFVSLALPTTLVAQTATYTAPGGLFTLLVPTGWQTQYDPELHQVTLSNGPLLAIVMVSSQNKSNPMSAQDFLDATATEFAGQCPTYRAVRKGEISLAGNPGQYSLFTCSDPKSPAVAETSAALTASPALIAITLISPLSLYPEKLPLLDAISNSLRLAGQPKPPPPNLEDLALTELRKACTVGAFSQSECARRLAAHNAGRPLPEDTPPTGALLYQDAQNRFTVAVPAGWQAIAEGDDGALGVQLRSGDSFINLMPVPPASTTGEVVLHQDQKSVDSSHFKRKPPFSSVGIIQLFGNGLDISYDHFIAASPQGDPIDSYVAGVGDLSGNDSAFLLVIASLQGGPSATSGGMFLATVQSIHLASSAAPHLN